MKQVRDVIKNYYTFININDSEKYIRALLRKITFLNINIYYINLHFQYKYFD